MKSRMFGLGLVSLVMLTASILLVAGWSKTQSAAQEHRGSPREPMRVEVQQGTTLGESQPLLVVRSTPDDDVLPIPDDDAATYVMPQTPSDPTLNEHSVLVSSKVALVSHWSDENDLEFNVSPALATLADEAAEGDMPQREAKQTSRDGDRDQKTEAEREREFEEGDEGEEGEEEAMPPNSVAQGNARIQPSDAERMAVSEGAAAVEQTTMGTKDAPQMIASFDGLGAGFEGPQGPFRGGNPSDNSLAVGPDHIVQVVNSRMAVFTKKGKKFDTTGKALYGPVNTNNVFRGCEVCGDINNGDAVVRYDQLADRWLIVMPIFSRLPYREDQPPAGKGGEPAEWSQITNKDQPGPAIALFQPPTLTAEERAAQEEAAAARRGARRGARGQGGGRRGQGGPAGPYAMCYAISTSSDPLGTYYRYHFVRPLFPDYPRPAVWPDGYYNPSSTGDNRISPEIATQKHACVVEREAMLQGKPAREQCVIIENVNFLNNADVDGKALPPAGAPNIMMAAGGTQLDGNLKDDGIYYWKFHVDWNDPAKTKVDGPVKIAVAPYNYLCGGQLTRCVTQPNTETTLDSQGDKIMQRLVYRRIGNRESIVAVHSINAAGGSGGGVRWYEFRVDGGDRNVKLYQQGTYAPGGNFRWMASPAMDSHGNIGIGYSFGGVPNFPGQRFTGRLDGDPLGQMTLKEAVLVEGQDSQTRGNRWQDYVQSAVDPSDDCTIWYVGDYVKDGAASYSTKIGAFRMPGCAGG